MLPNRTHAPHLEAKCFLVVFFVVFYLGVAGNKKNGGKGKGTVMFGHPVS